MGLLLTTTTKDMSLGPRSMFGPSCMSGPRGPSCKVGTKHRTIPLSGGVTLMISADKDRDLSAHHQGHHSLKEYKGERVAGVCA